MPNFRLYNSDLRVWIPEYNCGTYADLMLVDGQPQLNGERTDEILNPLVIVEVLSPSTEGYDRGEKFRKYRSLPSFCEYLLVSQTEPYIEQYHKLDDNSDSVAERPGGTGAAASSSVAMASLRSSSISLY